MLLHMLRGSIERFSSYIPRITAEAIGISSFQKVRSGIRTYGDNELTASLLASIYGIFSFGVPYSGRMATRELTEMLQPYFPNNDKRPLVQKLLGAGRHIPGMLLDQVSIWAPIIVGINTGSWENAFLLKVATNAVVCATIDAYNPIVTFSKENLAVKL